LTKIQIAIQKSDRASGLPVRAFDHGESKSRKIYGKTDIASGLPVRAGGFRKQYSKGLVEETK